MAKAQFAVLFGGHFIKAMAAQCSTARSHTKLLTVPKGLIDLSSVLLSSSIRPSSRNLIRSFQWLSV
jgi:hypothetical protein